VKAVHLPISVISGIDVPHAPQCDSSAGDRRTPGRARELMAPCKVIRVHYVKETAFLSSGGPVTPVFPHHVSDRRRCQRRGGRSARAAAG